MRPRPVCSLAEPVRVGRAAALLRPDVALQRLDILREGVAPRISDAADRAGHLAPEGLFHGDVARPGQLVQLHGEVAGRGAGLLADEDEVGAFDPDEDRHHGQPQLRMQQRIKLPEHGGAVLPSL